MTTISSSIRITVTLGATGYVSPLTITSIGNINASSPNVYGATGIYMPTGLTGGTINNAGAVNGGAGENYAAHAAPTSGGGVGMRLLGSVSVVNSGNISGGNGGYSVSGQSSALGRGGAGGDGIDLMGGTINNTGNIGGGSGGYSWSFNGGNGGVGLALLGAATVISNGAIDGGTGGTSRYGTAGNGGDGVDLATGAMLFNTGNILAGASGVAKYRANGHAGIGVSLASGATLNNQGVITGGVGEYNNFEHPATPGGVAVVLAAGAAGSNSGTLTGGLGGHAVNYAGGAGGNALNLGAGASFINSGTLKGGNGGLSSDNYAGHGGLGAYLGNGATLVNTGSIAGGQNGVDDEYKATAGSPGVSLNGGILLTSGTITGGAGNASHGENSIYHGGIGPAVQFGALTGTLEVEAGAVFNGNVVANSAVADVLEVSGTSSAALYGIGTSFQNFNDLSFATGAAWTISGSMAGLASGQTITGFTKNDAIIITGVAATSETFVSGVGLELSSGGTTETLDLALSPASTVFATVNESNTTLIAAAIGTLGTGLGNGITLGASGYGGSLAFTVTAAGTISAATAYAVYSSYSSASLLNSGTIIESATDGTAIAFKTGGTIFNAGKIEGTGTYTTGVYLQGGTIANAGTIAAPTGAGIFLDGGSVNNSGTISGNYGVILGNSGGYVSNTRLIQGASFGVFNANGTVVNSGTIKSTGGNAVYVDDGIVTNHGAIIAAHGYGIFGEANPGTIYNTGTISGGNGGIDLAAGGTIINSGTIADGGSAVYMGGSYSNLLIVDPGAVFIGGVTATGTSSTLELNGAASLTSQSFSGIGSQFIGFDTIELGPNTDWTLSGNAAGLASNETITGFTLGDTIDLTGISATSAFFAGGALTLSNGASALATLDLAEPPGLSGTDYFLLTPDGNNGTYIASEIPCFAAGTRLLGLHGEIRVEDVRAGDILVTVRDGGPASRKVVWTGRRSIDIARHPSPKSVRPIRIRAGAFGGGLPERDLRLSPEHAIYCGGLLFTAASLINGSSIYQEICARITYHHIELDAHDILLAEGLPCESYLDANNRDMFENEAVTQLHPDFTRADDSGFCVPLIRDGAALERLRERLASIIKKAA